MLHAPMMPQHAFRSSVGEADKKRAEARSEEGVVPEEDEEKTATRGAVAVGEKESGMDTKEDSGASAVAEDKPAAASPAWSPNTVIMFDWDDTLLASSFLSARGYRVDCVESPASLSDAGDLAQLRAQEQCVCALLKLALTFGTVNIVTNAEVGWVELSAQKFMPSVLPLLSRVTVLSARSTYEPAHPEAPLKWKYYAFHERLRSVFGESCMDARVPEGSAAAAIVADMSRNIVSFGDSHVEREAIRAVTRGVPGWRTKSVKFAERPTLEQLRRQLELVSSCFSFVLQSPQDLDLQLTVTLHTQPTTTTAPHST